MKGFASLMAILLVAPAIWGQLLLLKTSRFPAEINSFWLAPNSRSTKKASLLAIGPLEIFRSSATFRSKVSYPQERTDDQRRSSVPL
jgi:hypothetical protein